MVMDLSAKLSHGNCLTRTDSARERLAAQVDVVQHHGDNAEPAQKVDAGNALLRFLCCNRL